MKHGRWRIYGLVALGLLVPGIYVFWPFLFGNKLLLYTDIGSDSLNSYYPDFVHLSNYIRSDGFPSWSFHIGMGQDLAYATGFLFWEPVTWLPARLIAEALAYQQLLKVAIAGLIFFRFLQLRSLPPGVALLGSLLLGYSGYMCMGSCCTLLVEELLAFCAILLGIERVLQTGRWLFLAISLAVVGMINPFYLYLAALFLVCYFCAALSARNAWQPKPVITRAFVLAGIGFLGVALGAVVTLPYLHVVLNSPRGAGATTSFALLGSFPIFRLETPFHYATAALRLFSNDLPGTGDKFLGWQTYVEAPLTYCGLICLLLFPQVFVAATRRQRLLYLAFLAWLIVPTLFPWFRYAFWLFKGDYYRAYSLFSVLGIITLSMIAFARYIERGSLNLWLLGATIAVLAAILYLPIDAIQGLMNSRIRTAVTVFLAGYTVLLAVGQARKRQATAAYVVLVIVVIELSYFGRITVAERPTFQKSDLSGGLAARSDLVAGIWSLTRDDHSFFRTTEMHIRGDKIATDENNPMLLEYYATSSYSSFNDSNYIRFLAAVGALKSELETDTRWTVGLTGNFLLSLFAGEKYALAQVTEIFQSAPQYERLDSYGDYTLFRNQLSVPLGLTFTNYLPEDEFLQLSQDDKELALLSATVLPERDANGLRRTTAAEMQAELNASSYPALAETRRTTGLQLTSFSQSRLEGKLQLQQNGLLVMQTPFSRGWRAFQDGRPASTVRADIGLLGVPLDAGEHTVVLQYRNPWLVPGAIVSGVALVLLALLWWRRPRLAQSFA